jgi:hypothetical protein
MKISSVGKGDERNAVGESAKSKKHIWYPPPLCFCINCHLERIGLTSNPPLPPHTQLSAPPSQAGRVTNSDGGETVWRGMRTGTGGEVLTRPHATWSLRCQTSILGFERGTFT